MNQLMGLHKKEEIDIPGYQEKKLEIYQEWPS